MGKPWRHQSVHACPVSGTGYHQWESFSWGGVVCGSKCLLCGRSSRLKDFERKEASGASKETTDGE